MSRNPSHHRSDGSRRGIAAIETILCLPLIFLMAIATVEICAVIFLKETVAIAAFEGARVGVKKRATRSDAEAMANEVLIARGIQNGTVTVTPNSFSGMSELEPIQVTVSAPTNTNSAFVTRWFVDRTVESTVVMVREFDD